MLVVERTEIVLGGKSQTMAASKSGQPGELSSIAAPSLPKSAELVNSFAGEAGHHPVHKAAAELAGQHLAQWDSEDTCRNNADDDHAVAEAKRVIDWLNTARVRLIDHIDTWAATNVSESPQAARFGAALHTETLGQLIDRLAVAWVRAQKLVSTDAPGSRDDAQRALRQLIELCEAYDDLVRDLREGRRRLPSWRSLKRYGAAQ
jgi:hypothetical protein